MKVGAPKGMIFGFWVFFSSSKWFLDDSWADTGSIVIPCMLHFFGFFELQYVFPLGGKFWFSRNLSDRICWYSKPWKILYCSWYVYKNLDNSFDIHMSFLCVVIFILGTFLMKVLMKKWFFPNQSRINLGWFLDYQGMKKHQFECIGSFRNHEKHQIFEKNDKLKN